MMGQKIACHCDGKDQISGIRYRAIHSLKALLLVCIEITLACSPEMFVESVAHRPTASAYTW